MRILYQYRRIVLNDLESSFTTVFCTIMSINVELNGFYIIAFYCCGIPMEKRISGIQHGVASR